VPAITESFSDYFSDNQTKGADFMLSNVQDSVILTNSTYAVMVVYAKKYSAIEAFTNKIGALAVGTQYGGAAGTGAGTTGKVITIVGSGVVLGVAGLAGGVYIEAGVMTIAKLTAGGIVLGSGASGLTLLTNDIVNPPQTSVQVLFTKYDSEADLQALGCEYFPASLGTRPQ